jgi:hypothetical protein
MSTIELKSIGYIEHNISDELIAKTFKKFMAKVVIYREYKDGLKGLDEFSHIVLPSRSVFPMRNNNINTKIINLAIISLIAVEPLNFLFLQVLYSI